MGRTIKGVDTDIGAKGAGREEIESPVESRERFVCGGEATSADVETGPSRSLHPEAAANAATSMV
jgi:hypothetical protein